MRIFLLCCLVLMCSPSHAKEIAGVTIEESLQTPDGTLLYLNGAGIRSKFFMDIYIAELYMEHPAKSAEDVIAAPGGKRIIMYFLYDRLKKEKLTAAWNEGFRDNLSETELSSLRERITDFNNLFDTVKKDDIVVLDYIPGKGTEVTVAGLKKGVITGKDFNDALLKIWLGDKPVNDGLKKKLLGVAN
ncbi:MAG: chalcone isomerase family protein [Desulforhopalus sp.]